MSTSESLNVSTFPRNSLNVYSLNVSTFPRNESVSSNSRSKMKSLDANSTTIIYIIIRFIEYLLGLYPMNFEFDRAGSRYLFGFGGCIQSNDKLRAVFWMFLNAHKIPHQINDGRPTNKYGAECHDCRKITHWRSDHMHGCSFTLSINTAVQFCSNIEKYENDAKYQFGRRHEKITFKFLQKQTNIYTNILWVNEISECKLPYDIFATAFGKKFLIEVKATTKCDILENKMDVHVQFIMSINEFKQATRTQHYILAAHIEHQQNSVFEIITFKPPHTFYKCVTYNQDNETYQVSIPNTQRIFKSKFQIKNISIEVDRGLEQDIFGLTCFS
eukprot:479010_1